MTLQPLGKQLLLLLKPPVFEDSEKTRVGGLLHVMLLVIFVPAAVLPIIGFLDDPSFEVGRMVSIGLALFSFALLVQVHRGHLLFASVLLPTAVFLAVTVPIISESGLRDVDISGYFLLIVIASLLLGARGAMAFGGLAMAATYAAYFVETNKIAIIPPPAPLNIANLFTLLTSMGLTTVLLRIAVQRIKEGF